MEGGNCEQKPQKILWSSATKRSQKMKWWALPGPGQLGRQQVEGKKKRSGGKVNGVNFFFNGKTSMFIMLTDSAKGERRG